MTSYKRTITKEIYERAVANHDHIASEDYDKVFSESERYGYGVYGTYVFEKDGEYFVRFSLGDSCD